MSSITPESSVIKASESNERVEVENSASNTFNSNQEVEAENIIVDEPDVHTEAQDSSTTITSHDIQHAEEHNIDISTGQNVDESTKPPVTDLEKALNLRDKVDALIRRTIQTKQNCDKLEHDNKYLQDYVANLMNSGELLTKKY